jgi:Uncharacterized protein conserved in bacteria (DUF2147)
MHWDSRFANHSTLHGRRQSGKSKFMELQGPDKIKVRGFIGIALMGRNYFWTRAN